MLKRALFLVFVASVGCRSDPCSSCAITADLIATVGGSDGDGALSSIPLISAAFGDRRIVLQPDGTGGLPLLFTASGRFVGVVGRTGSGPGEFRSPSRALALGDSALVFDGVLRRATVITSSGTAAQSRPWMPIPYDVVVLGDGSFVAAAADGAILALTHIAPSGEMLREFGDTLPRNRRWHVAAGPDGFWSAPSLYRLRFEEWASPDSQLRAVEPVTPYFPPYEGRLSATEDRPPAPALRGFWVDELSRIWALLEIPATDWRAGLGTPRRGEDGQTYLPVLDVNRVYDTALLVIDPATGAVVAERRLDGWFYDVVEPFVITRFSQDDDGWYRGELWRVALRQ